MFGKEFIKRYKTLSAVILTLVTFTIIWFIENGLVHISDKRKQHN